MSAAFLEDDDAPTVEHRRMFSALASVRQKERECADLRRSARDASAAWQSAEADLVRLRMILESLDDGGDAQESAEARLSWAAAAPAGAGVLSAA